MPFETPEWPFDFSCVCIFPLIIAICHDLHRFVDGVMPACKINQNIGNCYTGSVFSSLLSVVSEVGDALDGKRVMMFSYGSGSVASIYRWRCRYQCLNCYEMSRVTRAPAPRPRLTHLSHFAPTNSLCCVAIFKIKYLHPHHSCNP